MDRIAISTAMPLPAASADAGAAASAGVQPPEWVHLLPAGQIATADGRGPYHLDDAAAVIAASASDGTVRLPIDENHSTDLAAPRGGAAPALAWIVELQARADGIWGRVEWNASGRALMSDRAYRGISPVFAHDKRGRVTRLLRAALTNVPNLPGLATLHHAGTHIMDLSAMRAALSLPDTADEAAIMARIAENARAASEARTALQAQQAETTRIAGETVALQARLQQVEQQRARDAAELYVDGAIRAGKPIPGALRDHYVARHMADAASVEKELQALPTLIGPAIDPASKPDDTSPVVLNAADRQFMKLMAVPEDKFVAARRGEVSALGMAA